MRGIFFDEDDARAVEARLLSDGYEAARVRDRLAGEDDDEDHPWAVHTDAPSIVLELLVDEYDGWLDEDDLDRLDHREHGLDHRDRGLDHRSHELGHRGGTDQPPAVPLDLPTAPKRIKRPGAR